MSRLTYNVQVDKELARMYIHGVEAYRRKALIRYGKEKGVWREGAELSHIDRGLVKHRFGEAYLDVISEGWGGPDGGVEFTVGPNDSIVFRK